MRVGRRLLIVAAAAVLVPVLISVALSRIGQPEGCARVERGDLVTTVEVTGTLRAVDSSSIGPPSVKDVWQFKIAMMADEGSEVRTGQPILAFDTSELQQRMQTKLADLDSARTEIEKKKVDLAVNMTDDTLARAEAEATLRKDRLLAEQPEELQSSIEKQKAKLDLELAELEVDLIRRRVEATQRAGNEELAVLETNLAQVETELQHLQEAIGKMTRVAPREGIVIHVANWRNEKMKVGDSCSVMEQVLEIPDLSRMEADGEVEEALAGRVREGQPVVLRLDAHPDHEYRATVSAISRAVQEKSWRNPLRVVRLKLAFEATDPERMRPGMRFRGEIEVDRRSETTLLPVAAVFRHHGTTVAFRRGLVGWRPVKIVLGTRNLGQVEVLEGLAPGDLISLEPRS